MKKLNIPIVDITFMLNMDNLCTFELKLQEYLVTEHQNIAQDFTLINETTGMKFIS